MSPIKNCSFWKGGSFENARSGYNDFITVSISSNCSCLIPRKVLHSNKKWCINDFWASLLKFLARINYLPLNERLFKNNIRESCKCSICDDDMVEDLHHFLFECKTLRGIETQY
jgi:hypothetical protein